MAITKYLFGGDTDETPESLKRKRRLAEALFGSAVNGAPKNVGEGLSALGSALGYRFAKGGIDRVEAAGRSKADEAMQALFGGGDYPSAPRGKDDAVAKALRGDTSRAGSTIDFAHAVDDALPKDYFSSIRSAESGGNDSAKNPRSSALGRYQFIGSTWQDLAKKYPDLGLTPDGRTDPAQQERAIRAFTADNAAVLQNAGIEPTGGNLYAAHFLGADGARNVLKSDPNASVASIVGNQVVKANPFLANMSVSQFQQWAARKGGGNGPVNLGGNTQVASLDPSAGLPEFDQYGNIPAVDGMGQDQRAKFRAWNSDPAGNEARNMQGIDPALSKVVERAKQIAGTNFVLGSGRRDQDQQKVAIANGWSGTMDSDHLTGGAADLWPVDENGAVIFDPQKQGQIVTAMKQAAQELGVDMEAGADWRKKDMPHFGMTNQTPMDNAPVPTPRPGGDQTAGIFLGTPEEMAAQNQPRIPAQMLDPRVMGGPQGSFAMPQQAQRAAPAPGPQRVAQSAQASDTDALAALGAQPANNGPSLQQLYQAASNQWLSDDQRAIVNSMIQQKQQESDPLRQLQLMKAKIDLQKAQGSGDADFKVVNDRLIKTYVDGRVEDVTPSLPEGAGPTGPFSGSSVEAQSLNWLVQNGKLTSEQAAQVGAGKQITDPSTGAILFMTPEGIFSQEPGQQPQPATPQGGSQLLNPAPLGGATASPGMPQAAPTPAPQREGAIPLTPPKAKPLPDATRNKVANVNQAFDTIGSELDRYQKLVEENGIEAMPGEAKDNLNSVRQGIMLQMKELFNLGVLNGPDLSLMERMIYDPVIDPLKDGGIANLPDQAWTMATGGAGARAKNSVAELKRMLTNIKDATNRSAGGAGGQPGPMPAPAATGVPEGVDAADWEFMTPEERAVFQ